MKLSLKQLVIPLVVQVLLIAIAASSAFQLWASLDQAIQQLELKQQQAMLTLQVRNQLASLQEEWPHATPDVLQEKLEQLGPQISMLGQVLEQQHRPSLALLKLQQQLNQAKDSLTSTSSETGAAEGLPEQALFRELIPFSATPTEALPVLEWDSTRSVLESYRSWATGSMVLVSISLLGLGAVLALFTFRHVVHLYRSLQGNAALLLEVQENERQRIAQELHDGVVQELVALKREHPGAAVEPLIENIRRLCHDLKPVILQDLGLVAAVRSVLSNAQQQGLTVKHTIDEASALDKLPKAYSLALYRITQECVTNSLRHAKASELEYQLLFQPEESPLLRLYIQDNGEGFSLEGASLSASSHKELVASANTEGLGLRGIQERVKALDGSIVIEPVLKPMERSNPHGLRYRILIPVRS